jgi:hypothetical protein
MSNVKLPELFGFTPEELALELGSWAANGFSQQAALEWLEADLTVEQALGWQEHGCGPGDVLGCWTQDPDEAFAPGAESD